MCKWLSGLFAFNKLIDLLLYSVIDYVHYAALWNVSMPRTRPDCYRYYVYDVVVTHEIQRLS